MISGSVKLPCLTTPAPTPEGRPPPKKMPGRLSPDVKQRWLQDQRQYAPWHYFDTGMMRNGNASLVIPPVSVKEQLQGLPIDYTDTGAVPCRSRHRMLANAWHFQVAKFMLLVLLQAHFAEARPCPAPRTTDLQFVLQIAANESVIVGPAKWTGYATTKTPTFSMHEHWTATDSAMHPWFSQDIVEPGLKQVVDKWSLQVVDKWS